MTAMEPPPKPSSTSLFQVYLRLRPALSQAPISLLSNLESQLYPSLPPLNRYLTVETPSLASEHGMPTHITIHPPSDSRKRAVEKFAFTKVFQEEASQLDIFKGTGTVSLVEGVLGERRDGLLATLGVTGSGKSHTILGSRSQRGLTQLSLDLLYRSLDQQVLHPTQCVSLISSLVSADASEAQILPASGFLDGVYGDTFQERGNSRANTPMAVGEHSHHKRTPSLIKASPAAMPGSWKQWSFTDLTLMLSPHRKAGRKNRQKFLHLPEKPEEQVPQTPRELPSRLPFWNTEKITKKKANSRFGDILQDTSTNCNTLRRHAPQLSVLPKLPDISDFIVETIPNMEYAILVSMYEVYNDRIFDLLMHSQSPKDMRRRALLFKSTESSGDRKVVAGLRKIVCGTFEEALMVLETGLTERRVAGTGSNSVSSRSHGFFCIEVKRRPRGGVSHMWSGAQLTVVDLAGSERARNAKTAGATLAEAGKINESLMYLGQCLQMQSDSNDGSKPSLVPYRQCKLTELLFSNSYPSSSHHASSHTNQCHRNPQKAVMIVTADPLGDFNATSQILRYSALAREVTVPRIPSVSSTIFFTCPMPPSKGPTSGRVSPSDNSAELEASTAEIQKLNDQLEFLKVRLDDEQERRKEAEEMWIRAEERLEEAEREVREECYGEMEKEMEEEKRRWLAIWEEEHERSQDHADRKIEIMSQEIQIHEDHPSSLTDYIKDLEDENSALHDKITILERQKANSQSPTKQRATRKAPTTYSQEEANITEVLFGLRSVDLNAVEQRNSVPASAAAASVPAVPKTPGRPKKMVVEMVQEEENWQASTRVVVAPKTPSRKVRKLTPREIVMDEEENGSENWCVMGSSP